MSKKYKTAVLTINPDDNELWVLGIESNNENFDYYDIKNTDKVSNYMNNYYKIFSKVIRYSIDNNCYKVFIDIELDSIKTLRLQRALDSVVSEKLKEVGVETNRFEFIAARSLKNVSKIFNEELIDMFELNFNYDLRKIKFEKWHKED